jgi:hypothetical protein
MTLFPNQATTDWIQYHKVEELGWPEKSPEGFSNFWYKNVQPPTGARVWLIAGEKAKPVYHYYLIEWFLIDRIAMKNKYGRNVGSGRRGVYLSRRTRIDGEPWFPEFKRTMARFSRGLSPITNKAIIKGLEKAAGLSVGEPP